MHWTSAAGALEKKLEEMVLKEIQKPWYIVKMGKNAITYAKRVLEFYKESDLKRISDKECWAFELVSRIIAEISYALYIIENGEKEVKLEIKTMKVPIYGIAIPGETYRISAKKERGFVEVEIYRNSEKITEMNIK